MSIATNSLRTYIFRIATALTGFLIGILISRLLGPSGKGYYSGVFLFYNTFIAVLGTLGPAITYQISRENRPPQLVFITATAYNCVIGLLTILTFWLYTVLYPGFRSGPLWLIVLITPLTLFLTNVVGLFQGLNRIIALNWIGIATGLFQLVLLGLGFLGLYAIRVKTAIIFWVLGQLLTFCAALWVSREFWLPPYKNHFNFPLLFTMLGFGWLLSLNSIIGILNSRIDSFLVLAFLKTKEYGLYSVAINGSEILWYASGAIAVAICAHIGMASKEQAGRLTAKAVRHTLLINIPLALVMWSIAWLIPLIYGVRFSPSLLPFKILLPGILAYSVAGIFSTYFTIQLGKPRVPLLVASISFMIDLLLSLLLIPKLGLLGGALANTISYLIAITVLIVIFCKNTRITLGELFSITKDDVADYQILLGNVGQFFRCKLRRDYGQK